MKNLLEFMKLFLTKLPKSKTLSLNVILPALIIAAAQFGGLELDPEVAAAVTVVIMGVANWILRYFTRKPLFDKNSLLE